MQYDRYNTLEQQNLFLDYVKRFFGFGENPESITIVLPGVEQTRQVSLKCHNYPLFPYEMSPDDVFTALRVYSILVLLYGNKVQVESSKNILTPPLGHRILIGSSFTNSFTSQALKDQFYHFGVGKDEHDIIANSGEKYSVKFDDCKVPMQERNIILDYCLISRSSRHGIVEVVLAGCRAYGQMALWHVLKDFDFYNQVLPEVEEKDFQILLRVPVNGNTITGWDILNISSKPTLKVNGGPEDTSRKTFVWLHLADLHFREGTDFDSNIVLKGLLEDVGSMSIESGLFPDFIAITGDIAYSGISAEYELAKKFFDKLLEVTHLTKDKLFIVPGNHDVDRDNISTLADANFRLTNSEIVNKLLADQDDRNQVFRRLSNYATFINEYFNHLTFDDENYYYVKNFMICGKKVSILGLNSAWLCRSDTDKNEILLGERQVREALEKAKDADIRIALLHHPFNWLKDFDESDSAVVLRNNCDFVLHGHNHQTVFEQNFTPDYKSIIIGAGASYETRDYPNSYNFVRLNTKPAEVFLRGYSNRSPGFWAKDTLSYKIAKDGKLVFDYQIC